MNVTTVSPSTDAGTLGGLLRTLPAQSRSHTRISELLDAASGVVGAVGYERLTTAMVATLAGASIGTVYRYFPDRISVLQGLAARNLDRFGSDWLDRLDAESRSDWRATVESFLDWYVAAFRGEPGFRSLRFGDVLDLRPREAQTATIAIVAGSIANVLDTTHPDTGRVTERLEVALTLADALLDRAFALDDGGDPALILESRRIALGYLEAP